MGREVRMVPADWQHPKDSRGRYIPLMDGDFQASDAEWMEGWRKWQQGMVESYGESGLAWRAKTAEDGPRYTEWAGARPSPDDYMPDWPEEQRTHLMMYEDTSEGTPISPAFETPEELARWLADNGASAFGDMTATYDEWLRVCRGGWAPSMVIANGEMKSGVAALSNP